MTSTTVGSDVIQSQSVLADTADIAQTFKSKAATVSTLTVGNPPYILPTTKGAPNQVIAVPANGNQLTFVTTAQVDGILAPDTATLNGLATFGATPEVLESSTVTLDPTGILSGITNINIGPDVGELSTTAGEITLLSVGKVKLESGETSMIQFKAPEINYVTTPLADDETALPLGAILKINIINNITVVSLATTPVDGTRMVIVCTASTTALVLTIPFALLGTTTTDVELRSNEVLELVSVGSKWVILSTTS